MGDLTVEQIKEWKRLAEKATPGPWTSEEDSCRRCREKGTAEYIIKGPAGANHGQFSVCADAAFIAASREAVVRLAREVLRMRGGEEAHP